MGDVIRESLHRSSVEPSKREALHRTRGWAV
jgi:hypothetical protein